MNLLSFLCRQVLEDLELLSTFTSVLRVPNITQIDDFVTVLEETNVFTSDDVQIIAKNLQQTRLVLFI